MAEKGLRLILRGEKDKTYDLSGRELTGARAVTGFVPARDDRLTLEEGAVLWTAELDFEPAGFASRGFSRPTQPSHSELFVDGTPYTLAQYPRRGGFLRISGVGAPEKTEWNEAVGKLDGGFYYDDPRPGEWTVREGLCVHGYWCYDWANSCESVAEFSPDFIKTAPPFGNYAFKKGQRFSFINVFEELSRPGDYYVSPAERRVWFVCAAGYVPKEAALSCESEPLAVLENCENIVIKGLTLGCCRGDAMSIVGGKNITVENCTFRNIGDSALRASGTYGLTVRGCTVHDCGDGGIDVTAGDRKTLSSGKTVIEDNHIYNIAKWTRCYVCGVNASGVGFDIRRNLIHDCPHTAILFWGNDFNIERNEIYSVVMETGDAGAVYTGRDFTFRGNSVSRNYIHHLGGVGMGTMGIYNDDCVSGTLMEGNVFCEASRAVFMGGGRDFEVRGNLFVNCYPSVEADGRGSSKHQNWRSMVHDTMRSRFYEVGGDRPPYTLRYPELAAVDALYRQEDADFPLECVIEDNLFCSERKIEYTWDLNGKKTEERNNRDLSPDDFEDFRMGRYDLKKPLNGCVRLEDTGPADQPVRVLAGFGDDGGLIMENAGSVPASGEYRIYGEGFEGESVRFSLAPGEKCSRSISRYEGIIEARSALPGARPARRH